MKDESELHKSKRLVRKEKEMVLSTYTKNVIFAVFMNAYRLGAHTYDRLYLLTPLSGFKQDHSACTHTIVPTLKTEFSVSSNHTS